MTGVCIHDQYMKHNIPLCKMTLIGFINVYWWTIALLNDRKYYGESCGSCGQLELMETSAS